VKKIQGKGRVLRYSFPQQKEGRRGKNSRNLVKNTFGPVIFSPVNLHRREGKKGKKKRKKRSWDLAESGGGFPTLLSLFQIRKKKENKKDD